MDVFSGKKKKLSQVFDECKMTFSKISYVPALKKKVSRRLVDDEIHKRSVAAG